MKTDTARLEQGGFSASSNDLNPGSNSDRSAGSSRKNSRRAPAADAGEEAERNRCSLDVLLSILQADLGEIRDFGGSVRLYNHPDGLIIQLPNVAICQTHKQIHSGEICPHC